MMLCYVMLCYGMLCYAILCYAMLCYAMLCYAMLCYVILKAISRRRCHLPNADAALFVYIVLASTPDTAAVARLASPHNNFVVLTCRTNLSAK